MAAEFDLSQLDEIPDVIAPGTQTAPPPLRPLGASPARSATRQRRALAVAAGVVWLAAQVVVLGLRTDTARLGTAYLLAQVALPALLSAALVGAVLWPGRDSLGASSRSLAGLSGAALAVMAAVVLSCPMPFAYVPPPGSMAFGQWVLVCGDIVAIMGAVPLALMAGAFRSSFPAAATARTAALGAACGLAAVTAMHLHCENIEPLHLAVGHIVPATALALFSAFVLRRVTRA